MLRRRGPKPWARRQHHHQVLTQSESAQRGAPNFRAPPAWPGFCPRRPAASREPQQRRLLPRFAADSPLEEDRFELPVPPKTPGVLAVVLSRSRRLSLAESHYLIRSAPYEGSESVRSRCRDHQEEFRATAMWKRSVSGRRFADVRRMHQAGWFVKHISDELESELFQDFLRSTIVRVMPSVDLRQSQFFPGAFERAERCFRCEALAPAALHKMEPDFEIRLAGRSPPQPTNSPLR